MNDDLTYFEFRGFKVFVDSNELIVKGKAIKLKPKEMAVLAMLYQHVDNTISRSDLLDSVWGESGGNDLGLTQAISKLRKVIGDNTVNPQIIKTIHKKGYRLVSGAKLRQNNTSFFRSLFAQMKQYKIQTIIMLLLLIIILLIVTILIIKPRVIRMRVKKYKVPKETALAHFHFYNTASKIQSDDKIIYTTFL